MRLKCVGVLLAGFLLSFSAIADTLKLKQGHPETYIVKKGDTLWDISTHFLDSPWLWPRLWQSNPQVKNPHLIYPGDKLYLTWVNGEPRLSRKRLRKLSPTPRIEEKRSPIPTIPLSVISSFLSRDHILDPTLLEGAPRLMGDGMASLRLLAGDTLYAEGEYDKELLYGIYRLGENYVDSKTEEVLGTELTFVGLSQVEQSANVRANSKVTPHLLLKSAMEAKQGDRILPIPEYENLPAFFIPTPTPAEMLGNIVAALNNASALGKWDVVVINKGSREQIQPGAMFAILQPGPEVVERNGKVTYKEDASRYEKIFNSGDDGLQLPDEKIGEMMVFKVYEKTSIAVITRSEELIGPNYQIEGMDF